MLPVLRACCCVLCPALCAYVPCALLRLCVLLLPAACLPVVLIRAHVVYRAAWRSLILGHPGALIIKSVFYYMRAVPMV